MNNIKKLICATYCHLSPNSYLDYTDLESNTTNFYVDDNTYITVIAAVAAPVNLCNTDTSFLRERALVSEQFHIIVIRVP